MYSPTIDEDNEEGDCDDCGNDYPHIEEKIHVDILKKARSSRMSSSAMKTPSGCPSSFLPHNGLLGNSDIP